MAGKGGAMPGAGRKKKVDEEKAQRMCAQAVINVYGSIEGGIETLLKGSDEKLKLFVWQHILGNPETKSKVKVSDPNGNPLPTAITVEVVRTIHNKDTEIANE